MKRLLQIFLCALAVCAVMIACKEKEDLSGSIYGTVTDKATGEPINVAGVELHPGGAKTVTGMDGVYSFPDLKEGDYTMTITKTGYADKENVRVSVISGQRTPCNVQLEKDASTLIVVDDDNKEITTLNFGGSPEVVSRAFNIYNTGFESITWEISFTADWIKSCTPTQKGTLNPTYKQPLLLTIDRSKFEEGRSYKTTLDIISDAGTRQIEVKASTIEGEEEENGEYIILKAAKLMVQQQDLGELRWSDADRICKNSTLAGYTDWRLPTLDELITIYNHRDNIRNLKSAAYWSSEYSVNFGYGTLNMNTGSTYYESSTSKLYNVRAVRSIEAESLPALEMTGLTNLSKGSVVFRGEITSTGYPSYTERGFVCATQSMPTLENAQVKLAAPVTETAAYEATATELQIEQTYYVRAYAINELGTAYSANERTFELQAVLPKVGTGNEIIKNIKEKTATLKGIISEEGYPVYIERGFVYGLLQNPTIADTKKNVPGSGTGWFSANLTDLEEGNVYYVRAYATTEKETVYGGEVTLDFHAVLPGVRTDDVTAITETGAVLNGTILLAGDPPYTEKGFIYGTMSVPTFDNPDIVTIPISGSSTGAYNYSLSGLIDGTTYYVRAYAKVGDNVTYGEIVNFKAESPYYVILLEAKLMVQKKDLGEGDWYSAQLMCESSMLAGFMDWRLPSKEELMVVYNNKGLIGGFTNGNYWSSTNSTTFNNIYDYISFWNGSLGNYDGGSLSCCIRAVRTIK